MFKMKAHGLVMTYRTFVWFFTL